MNKVIIRGNLGADVELRKTTTSNKSVANFRVASNKKYKDAAGQKVEQTEWHSIVAWEALADVVAQYCHKGSGVLIEGELKTSSFMGKTQYENGQDVVDGAGNPIMVRRYKTEIIAKNVEFLDKAPSTTAYTPAAGVAAVPGQPVVAAAPTAPTHYLDAAGQLVPIVMAAPAATVAPVVNAAANPAVVAPTFVGAGGASVPGTPVVPTLTTPASVPAAGGVVVAPPGTVVEQVVIPGL